MILEITRNFPIGKEGDATSEDVAEDALKGMFLNHPDKSDPLNRAVVIGFKIGSRIAAFSRIDPAPTDPYQFSRAIEGAFADVLRWAIDHADELKDRTV